MKATPSEQVILVNPHGNRLTNSPGSIKTMDELAAHKNEGTPHEAFSVFIYDPIQNLYLLQQSATNKYQPETWANACCGHPRVTENPQEAACRRLKEETNLDIPIKYFNLTLQHYYQVNFPQKSLSENEYLYIYLIMVNKFHIEECLKNNPVNPAEIKHTRWESPTETLTNIKNNQCHKYAKCFKTTASTVYKKIKKINLNIF